MIRWSRLIPCRVASVAIRSPRWTCRIGARSMRGWSLVLIPVTHREGHHSDHPPHADYRASTDRDLRTPSHDLRTPGHPAPATIMAVGKRLDRTVRPGQRPTNSPRDLTTQQPLLRGMSTPMEHPGQQGPAVPHAHNRPRPTPGTIPSAPYPSVDRGLAVAKSCAGIGRSRRLAGQPAAPRLLRSPPEFALGPWHREVTHPKVVLVRIPIVGQTDATSDAVFGDPPAAR